MTKATFGAMALTAALLTGCRTPMPPPAPMALEAPVVQPDPRMADGPTLLERFEETCRRYEAERTRAAGMAADIEEQRAARLAAEAESARLRAQAARLQQKADELDALAVKYEAVAKSCLELQTAVTDLRRELLNERLISARHEQALLALKIEKAMEHRKDLLERPARDNEARIEKEPHAPNL